MKFSPIFIAAAVFLIFMVIPVFRLLRFLLRVRATVNDGAQGKTIHLDTPLGVVDLKPSERPDSDLASMLRYPGAQPVETSGPQYEVEFHLAAHNARSASETYWTADAISAVREFFERELPDWSRDIHFQHGFRLTSKTGSERAITLRTQGDRTLIEYAVIHPLDAGQIVSTDSTFGTLG